MSRDWGTSSRKDDFSGAMPGYLCKIRGKTSESEITDDEQAKATKY